MHAFQLHLPLSLGLAACVAAGPVATVTSDVFSVLAERLLSPTPTVTQRPQLVQRQDAVLTTIPVSSCINFEDPAHSTSGCYCSGYAPLLSYLSGPDSCSYTDVVTATNTAPPNAFPCTSTYSNAAVVAYATTTVYPGGGSAYCAGDSTTIQAGSSVSLEMDASGSGSVNVGYATEQWQRDDLYTQVTNNLKTACPTPTSGETITVCTDVPAVTNVAYVDQYGDLYEDGKLDMVVDLASYSDANALEMLIVAIGQGMSASAGSAGNMGEVYYDWYQGCAPTCSDVSDFVNLTNIPNLYQSLFTEQTEATNGAVIVQNLEVSLTMEGTHGGAFACSDVGLVLSGLAAAGSLIPGFGWLGLSTLGSVTRFGLAADCGHGPGS